MRGDVEAGAAFDGLDRSFKRGVLERFELAAAVANEVVVVAVAGADRLVAGDAVADVDPLHGAAVDERVDGAVDAGEADVGAAADERLVDLLGAVAALLRGEKVDDLGAGCAESLPGRGQARTGVVGPTGHN